MKGKRAVVAGLGVSGVAVAGWLHGLGADLRLYDSKASVNLDELKCVVTLPESIFFSDRKISEVLDKFMPDFLVAAPGVPPSSEIIKASRKRGVPVICELALAASFWQGPVVAVTGTNGKTTTVRMISCLMKAAGISHITAGNIAPPLAACMDKNSPECTAVLEVSSFQLEYFPETGSVDLPVPEFSAAAFLNLAPDHMDRHGSMESYAMLKRRIFDYVADGACIINMDDLNVMKFTEGSVDCSKRLFFGTGTGLTQGAKIDITGKKIEFFPHEGPVEEYPLSGWSLAGLHNLENLACAVIMARLAGAAPEKVKDGIKSFRLSRHRLETVAYLSGVCFLNDSKATNVAAVLRALEAVPGRLILIVGGSGKGEDYTPLARAVALRNWQAGGEEGRPGGVIRVIIMGAERDRLRECFKDVVDLVEIKSEVGQEAMEAAVTEALRHAEPGCTVLFSPACASFDMFRSYKERGDVFSGAVKKLCGFQKI